MKNIQFIFLSLIINYVSLIFCMDNKISKFNINGEYKLMIEHIVNALNDKSDPKKESFITNTHAVNCLDGKLLVKGDLSSLDAEDFKEIENGNFVYSRCYTSKINEDSIRNAVGAIIVGTKDDKKINQLFFNNLKARKK